MSYVLVFLGGGIGSMMRLIISVILSKTTLNLPLSTLLANVISCAVFGGLMYAYQEKSSIPETYKHFVLIGICGGLSTFSTFSYETFELLKQDLMGWAIANVLLNCSLCIGLFWCFIK